MLIPTAFEDEKVFIEIFEPYEYEDFVAAAAEEFNIDNPEDIIISVNSTKVMNRQFKGVILQYYKVPTFYVELTIKEIDPYASSVASSINSTVPNPPSTLPQYVDMGRGTLPGVAEIKNLSAVSLILNNYRQGQPLRNKDRVKIAKGIIDECVKDNPNRVLNRDEFYRLTQSICTIFDTEVPSAYFMPSAQGEPARGKLWSAYNNKRNALSLSGLISRRNKPGLKRKACPSPTPMPEEEPESIQYLQENATDWPTILDKWRETFKYRINELKSHRITAKGYLDKYLALNETRGIELVSLDVQTIYPPVATVGNWLTLYSKVIKEARNLRVANVVQVLENIDQSEDEKTVAQLALLCIPYILPYCGKRSEAKEKGNATKAEIQERFIKEFKTYKELKEGPEPADLQIRFVRSAGITYADFTIGERTFQSSDLLQALNMGFMYITALKLDYPRICTHVWQFVQLAIFQIPLSDFKSPSVEMVINDLLNNF